MLKIRTWSNLPFEDELLPEGAPPCEVVDDAAAPLTGELADFVDELDHDVRFAYKDQGKVYVMLGIDAYAEEVPEHLVDLVPGTAFEAYDRATAPGPGFFSD